MKIFRIDCDGVIYHVSGSTKVEAVMHLIGKQMYWNDELDAPTEDWKVTEVTEPFRITYNESDKKGNPITIMSDELIKGATKPDVLCCSEWF